MTAQAEAAPEAQETACYVFGIVPAGARLPDDLVGLDGGEVRLVRHGDVAALIGGVVPDGPLGTRDDLLTHEDVVTAASDAGPILPFRFGAVVTAPDAVEEELLAPHHAWFADVLADLRGRREFIVTGTYEEDAVLRELLAERPEIGRLRAAIGDLPVEASYADRLQLGETIVRALEEKRAADTDVLIAALDPYADALALREPSGEEAAADVAFLVADDARADFEDAVDALGEDWSGRVALRLLGPLAPYDFVPIPEEV